LTGEGAFEIAAAARSLAAAGRDVIQLAIGEPDWAPPPRVVEAVLRALHEGDARYGPPEGLPALREAIAASVGACGIRASADHVVVTPGAKQALAYAVLCAVQPGDEVLVPDPGFPIYASLVRFAGGTPVPYPVLADGDPLPDDLSLVRQAPRARLIIINSPHNPTGAVATRAGLERLAAAAVRHDLTIISDEVYARLVHGAEPLAEGAPWPVRPVRAPSIAEIPGLADRTIVIDSFSKTYAMTGFRLGFGLFPARLARAAALLSVNVHSCVPAFVQRAGLAALEAPDDELRARRAELRLRRDIVVRSLRAVAGVECAEPRGAFYVFPRIEPVLRTSGETSASFCASLLRQHGVALLPGSAFGAAGEGALRIALTVSGARMEEALRRTCAFLERGGSATSSSRAARIRTNSSGGAA
jgi:aspartate/methionine/tyrosine aminotransferase